MDKNNKADSIQKETERSRKMNLHFDGLIGFGYEKIDYFRLAPACM
jgi:hypothetical protein